MIDAVVIVVVGLALIFSSLRLLKAYERGVIFRLGAVREGVRGPGVVFVFPIFDRLKRVDLRTTRLQLPAHDVTTSDGVRARVVAEIDVRVSDPMRATTQVGDFAVTSMKFIQQSLRQVLDGRSFDELCDHRADVAAQLRTMVEAQVESIGVEVPAARITSVTATTGDDPATPALPDAPAASEPTTTTTKEHRQ